MYTLDQLSDRLFGRRLRLQVASWILLHEQASFFQGQAAQGIGYSAGEVTKELNRLVDLGMIIRHEISAGDRRQYYTRVDECPFWEIIRVARAAVDQEQPDTAAQ